MALESLLLLLLAAPRMRLAPRYLSLGGAPISGVRHARIPPQHPLAIGLALHGIANTPRARWPARHGRDGAAGNSDSDRRRPGDAARTSARPSWRADKTRLIWWIALQGGSLGSPLVGCSGDLLRLNNDAAHIAEDVAADRNQDLLLCDAVSQPVDHIAKMMTNGRHRNGLLARTNPGSPAVVAGVTTIKANCALGSPG